MLAITLAQSSVGGAARTMATAKDDEAAALAVAVSTERGVEPADEPTGVNEKSCKRTRNIAQRFGLLVYSPNIR